MSNCSTQLSVCYATVANLTVQFNSVNEKYINCTDSILSQCDASFSPNYNQAYHIGGIFVILVASALGAGFPVVSFHVPVFRVNPYLIILGKCMGIGVVLACALVHMLQPGSQSLTSPCVPWEFNTDYNAYAFLYAMLAGLIMQFLDYHVILYVKWRVNKKKTSCDEKEMEETPKDQVGHSHEAMHAMTLDKTVLKSIEAYMLEFAVTVHSVFIGMTVGMCDDPTLDVLLPALCFHQMLEGVALGSRVADAKFGNHIQELILICIFSFAAPVGMAIGIVTREIANLNGETYLLVQGTFDSFCGGILLYIGYFLLLKDFPEDMERHCSGKKKEHLMRYGMFIFLWIGAGVMAYIGKYL